MDWISGIALCINARLLCGLFMAIVWRSTEFFRVEVVRKVGKTIEVFLFLL